jgi:hypothetical protein
MPLKLRGFGGSAPRGNPVIVANWLWTWQTVRPLVREGRFVARIATSCLLNPNSRLGLRARIRKDGRLSDYL